MWYQQNLNDRLEEINDEIKSLTFKNIERELKPYIHKNEDLLTKIAKQHLETYTKLNDELAAGKIDMDDYRDGMLKAIPVFGEFFDAGQKIKLAISGVGEEIAKQNAATALQLKQQDQQ